MTAGDCPFCLPETVRIFYAGNLTLAIWDAYPVSPGHALLIPRRHVASWFDMTPDERKEIADALGIVRETIARTHGPDGFNIGVNVGPAAGQTVGHVHVHVIPRYTGDMGDPRGGVRHVLPGRGFYAQGEPIAHVVRDTEGPWSTIPDRLPLRPPVRATDIPLDATAFGERILQLLDEGRFTATYKYAVLLALTDLCIERGPSASAEVAIAARELAERVLELYWPQAAQYESGKRSGVLAQNTSGQAEIVSAIRRFRERSGANPSDPLNRSRSRDPHGFERLLRTLEWKLIEMPLPRLQVIGDTQTSFLYRINWDDRVRRHDIERDDFDRRIYLHRGVAEHLVRLSGLLRPLIQQKWTDMVVKMNRDATDEARLQEFLFGSRRVDLGPVRADLLDLQNNRCFYCRGSIDGAADVDHFIPWVRHPDNGIENLVVADQRCNNNKRDFLAAGEHVEHWAARFSRDSGALSQQLSEIAQRSGWERHPERTLNTARAMYLRLPDEVRLWVRKREFVPVGDQRDRLIDSLGEAVAAVRS